MALIERIPKTHRYRITAKGLRTAIFYTRLYNRSLRTGLAIISSDPAQTNPSPSPFKQPKSPSTLGTRKKISRPKNLTQLIHKAFDQGL
jgi:hypothetical protein